MAGLVNIGRIQLPKGRGIGGGGARPGSRGASRRPHRRPAAQRPRQGEGALRPPPAGGGPAAADGARRRGPEGAPGEWPGDAGGRTEWPRRSLPAEVALMVLKPRPRCMIGAGFYSRACPVLFCVIRWDTFNFGDVQAKVIIIRIIYGFFPLKRFQLGVGVGVNRWADRQI